MNYLRVDTNRNNTIIEISSGEFNDLLTHEIQAESDFDFPTSQPSIYYRWNGAEVEINSEDTIISYFEENGTLSGLDLNPCIIKILSGTFIPNQTKEITIEGVNFSEFSSIEISGSENVINAIYFDSPIQLRVNITAGTIGGYFDLTIHNDSLNSQESGNNKIKIEIKTIVDFRTESIASLGLEMSPGVSVAQDVTRGINFTVPTSSWNRGVKFTNYPWYRSGNTTYEVVFVKTGGCSFMHGIASSLLDISDTSSGFYYRQEIGMFNTTSAFNRMYGGGDVSNWTQTIGINATITDNVFYKLKLSNGGENGALCSIYSVDPDNWDDEVLLHSWISDCSADDEILIPFMLPYSTGGMYYLTGIKY